MALYATTTEMWPIYGHDRITTQTIELDFPYLSLYIAVAFVMCGFCWLLCAIYCIFIGNGWWCCADPDDWTW